MEDDRSWMYGPRYVNKKVNPVFVRGVEEFFNYAFAIPNNIDRQNRIKCPCANCGCTRWWDRYTIGKHLLKSGFRLYYETWTMHGEHATVRLEKQSQTVVEEVVVESVEVESPNNMIEMVVDAAGSSFNGEQPNLKAQDADIWYSNTNNNAHGDNYSLGALGKTRLMYRPGGSQTSSLQSQLQAQSYSSAPPSLRQEDINAISSQVLGMLQAQLNQFMEEMKHSMGRSSSHQRGSSSHHPDAQDDSGDDIGDN